MHHLCPQAGITDQMTAGGIMRNPSQFRRSVSRPGIMQNADAVVTMGMMVVILYMLVGMLRLMPVTICQRTAILRAAAHARYIQ